MTPKTKGRKPMSAKEHDAYCRTMMKRIDARLKEGRRMDAKIAPALKALKRFVDE